MTGTKWDIPLGLSAEPLPPFYTHSISWLSEIYDGGGGDFLAFYPLSADDDVH